MFKYIRIHDGFVLVSQFLLRLTIFKANGLYQHSFLSIVKDEHTQTQRTGVCGWVVGLLLSTPTPGHAGNSCLAFKGISWQWNLVARAGISRIRPQICVDTRESKTLCGDNRLGVAEQAGTGILRAGDPTLAWLQTNNSRDCPWSHSPGGSLGHTLLPKGVPLQRDAEANTNLSSTCTLGKGG